MANESHEAKRVRKAEVTAPARARAAHIAAGDIPDWLGQPSAVTRQPRLPGPRHKGVQAPLDRPDKALMPPTRNELRPRERGQYADNAQKESTVPKMTSGPARPWPPGTTVTFREDSADPDVALDDPRCGKW
ncbi:hypothetical protein ACFXAW_30210 [Streptomyces sp. NPDC059445]|uniref:hypothetical protein n=1 Tax=Streptomyces sp. NPDC059445 TaxID=3346832 RepID=UPI0036C4C976